MEQKSNYTIVGIFVLCLFLGIATTMVWMSKYSKDKEYEYYKINTKESVSGLNEKSTVKLNGIAIGDIEKLLINEDNAEEVSIIIKVIAGSPIKEDTRATIQTQGITGLNYIDLMGGTQNSKRLVSKDEELAIILSSPSVFARVDKGFSTMMVSLEETMIGIKGLTSQENIENVRKILKNAALITESIVKITKDLEARENDLEQIFTKTMEVENSIINVANSFSAVALFLGETIKTVDLIAGKLNKKIDDGTYDLNTIAARSFMPLQRSFEDFGALIRQLKEVAESFERSPSDLLFKSRDYKNGPGE